MNVEELQRIRTENNVLRGFKQDIEFVAEREANDDAELAKAVKERIDAYKENRHE